MNNEEKILTMLEKHGVMLEKHGVMLEKHGVMLEKQGAILEQVQTDIKDLKQGQAETNQQLDKLENNVQLIMHIQNEDYTLLKAVDEKVTNLFSISEVHEQKFQKLRTL